MKPSKNNQSKYLLVTGILLILCASMIVSDRTIQEPFVIYSSEPTVFTSSYIDANPIVITNNADFSSEGFTGAGTEADPYILEGIRINSTENCIDIRDTTAHFIVRNCFLVGGYDAGVYLRYLQNGTVEDCVFQPRYRGVRIYQSGNVTIDNNTITECSREAIEIEHSDDLLVSNNFLSTGENGVYALYVERLTLFNNTITGFGEDGVYITRDNNTLTQNTISDCDRGIYLSQGDHHIIFNNTLIDNRFGMECWQPRWLTILNNTFTNCGLDIGQYIWSHVIDNNTVNGKELGYFLSQSDMEMDGNLYGQIILATCDNVTIRFGTFSAATIGVTIGDSLDCKLINGTLSSNYQSIAVRESTGTVLANNSIEESDFGIYLEDSTLTEMITNDLIGTGVKIDGESAGYWNHDSTGTTVNGKLLGMFYGETSQFYDGGPYGQIIMGNCDDVVVINGEYRNVAYPVQVGYSTDCVIVDATMANVSYGIYSYHSTGCIFDNNTIENVTKYAIHLYSSTFITVNDNSIHGAGAYGINAEEGTTDIEITENTISGTLLPLNGVFMDRGIIHNNTFFDSKYGVYLQFCDNLTISNNTVYDIEYEGIYCRVFVGLDLANNTIFECDTGIQLSTCDFVNITDNAVFDNSGNGIELWSADNVSVELNTIQGNGGDGIYCYGARDFNLTDNVVESNADSFYLYQSSDFNILDNEIHDNGASPQIRDSARGFIFGNNMTFNTWGLYVDTDSSQVDIYGNFIAWSLFFNARDHGTDNQWDDGVSVGNIWGDWNGVGYYEISGDANSVDHFPTQADTVNPIIDTPEDVVYNFGDTGVNITWTASDLHPYGYEILQDGERVVLWQNWHGYPITRNLYDLDPGTYNFTIIVFDSCYNNATDTVMVTVIDATNPIIEELDDVEYQVATTGHWLNWEVSDSFPASYTIERNGTEIESGAWSGEDIQLNIDGLDVGIYEFVLTVYDETGNWAEDSVIVQVYETSTEPTTTTTATDTTGNTNSPTTTTQPFSGEFDPMLIIILIGAIAIIAVITVIVRSGKWKS